MQELAPKAARTLPAAVAHVARDRQAEIRQMRADLVRAPRSRVERKQRVPATGGELLVVGDRCAAAGHDRHPLAIPRVTADRRLDAATRGRRLAAHEREVLLLDAAVAELAHQAGLRRIGLGDDDQAARLLVEPMDDPGSADAGDRAEGLAAIARTTQEGVHEGARSVPGRRMHDEPGRLVDDQHVVVLVGDDERDRLRDERLIRRRAEHDADPLSPGEAVARPAPASRPPAPGRRRSAAGRAPG